MRQKLVVLGTIKTGRIMAVSMGRGNKDPHSPRVVCIAGDDKEGYLLFNNDRCPFIPATGMHVEFVATEGGPTGVYWRITRQVPPTGPEPEVVRTRFLDNVSRG